MGDHADDLMFQELKIQSFLEEEQRNSELRIWTTKNFDEIYVHDMETSHIKNSVKCIHNGKINKGKESNKIWLDIFQKEINKRNS